MMKIPRKVRPQTMILYPSLSETSAILFSPARFFCPIGISPKGLASLCLFLLYLHVSWVLFFSPSLDVLVPIVITHKDGGSLGEGGIEDHGLWSYFPRDFHHKQICRTSLLPALVYATPASPTPPQRPY